MINFIHHSVARINKQNINTELETVSIAEPL